MSRPPKGVDPHYLRVLRALRELEAECAACVGECRPIHMRLVMIREDAQRMAHYIELDITEMRYPPGPGQISCVGCGKPFTPRKTTNVCPACLKAWQEQREQRREQEQKEGAVAE